MIPKILHQTSKDGTIPADCVPYAQRTRELHSGWDYKLWADGDAVDLIKKHRPRLLKVFESVPRKIMRADIIRCCIMERIGGLYCDLDYEFLRPFPYVDNKIVLPRESGDGEPVYLGNAVFASEKGHPFWSAVLDRMETYSFEPYSTLKEEDVIDLTGPGLITAVYRAGFVGNRELCIPAKEEFNPLIPWDEASRAKLERQRTVLGIHHCQGSWRALTKGQRAVSRLWNGALRLARLFNSCIELLRRPLRNIGPGSRGKNR